MGTLKIELVGFSKMPILSLALHGYIFFMIGARKQRQTGRENSSGKRQSIVYLARTGVRHFAEM